MQDVPYMDLEPDVKGNRARDRRGQPENNSKLVLLFFIMVIGTYTAIANHRFHLPDAEGSDKTHRKHLRLENQALREQFQSHVMNKTRVAAAAGRAGGAGGLADATSRDASLVRSIAVERGQGGASGTHRGAVLTVQRGDSAGVIGGNTEDGSEDGIAGGAVGGAEGGTGGGNADAPPLPPPSMQAMQQAVKGAMLHAWNSYEKHAWGRDELQPMSLVGKDSFAGMGATILDSLSTLWIMGLKEEFARGRAFVNSSLVFPRNEQISLFETNIRVVGGLLSAYDLSGDELFLRRTQELVDLMLVAMEPSNPGTGIPQNSITLGRPGMGSFGTASIAECGSLQLEWCTLSLRSRNSTYQYKALKIFDAIHAAHPGEGLIPTMISRNDASGSDSYSMGAAADSFYEYLLKVWLLRGKKDEVYRAMWEAAVDEAIEKLVGVTSASGLVFVGSLQFGGLQARQEHLACFFPGNVALGVHSGAVRGAKAKRYMAVAEGITRTCWEMYDRMPSGLAAESVNLVNSTSPAGEMYPSPTYYILRPETVESFFYMWRITGDPKYQKWGWSVFQSIEKNCRVEGGYSGTADVTQASVMHDDTMQSFFLAETLKYLYLLFSPPDVMPLDEWVFNTEAHPFRLGPTKGHGGKLDGRW